MDLYEILGLTRDADEEDLRSAYRKLARQCHPDAGESGNAERFRTLNEAYETLRDPARRKEYDRTHFPPVEPLAGPAAYGAPLPPRYPAGFGAVPVESMVGPAESRFVPGFGFVRTEPFAGGFQRTDKVEDLFRMIAAEFFGHGRRFR
jgi:curved DNA-binding protein CbpA